MQTVASTSSNISRGEDSPKEDLLHFLDRVLDEDFPKREEEGPFRVRLTSRGQFGISKSDGNTWYNAGKWFDTVDFSRVSAGDFALGELNVRLWNALLRKS